MPEWLQSRKPTTTLRVRLVPSAYNAKPSGTEHTRGLLLASLRNRAWVGCTVLCCLVRYRQYALQSECFPGIPRSLLLRRTRISRGSPKTAVAGARAHTVPNALLAAVKFAISACFSVTLAAFLTLRFSMAWLHAFVPPSRADGTYHITYV